MADDLGDAIAPSDDIMDMIARADRGAKEKDESYLAAWLSHVSKSMAPPVLPLSPDMPEIKAAGTYDGADDVMTGGAAPDDAVTGGVRNDVVQDDVVRDDVATGDVRDGVARDDGPDDVVEDSVSDDVADNDAAADTRTAVSSDGDDASDGPSPAADASAANDTDGNAYRIMTKDDADAIRRGLLGDDGSPFTGDLEYSTFVSTDGDMDGVYRVVTDAIDRVGYSVGVAVVSGDLLGALGESGRALLVDATDGDDDEERNKRILEDEAHEEPELIGRNPDITEDNDPECSLYTGINVMQATDSRPDDGDDAADNGAPGDAGAGVSLADPRNVVRVGSDPDSAPSANVSVSRPVTDTGRPRTVVRTPSMTLAQAMAGARGQLDSLLSINKAVRRRRRHRRR